MRLNVPLLFYIFNFFLSIGQNQNDSLKLSKDSILEQFYQYNVTYPEEAVENNIEGTIILMFDVDSTCSFENRTQKNKLGYGCDEISWITLDKFEFDIKKQNNNKCQSTYNISIPVVFTLNYD
jgi:hypothetical protein